MMSVQFFLDDLDTGKTSHLLLSLKCFFSGNWLHLKGAMHIMLKEYIHPELVCQ